MASRAPKTLPHEGDVAAFLKAVPGDVRRRDGEAACALMGRVTGEPAVMWGPTMVGFGQYSYKYESGHRGTMFLVGFSPRKAATVLYIMPGFTEHANLMARLGKFTTGKSCLYVKNFDRIDMGVLEELVRRSVDWMRRKYP
ncbi:MAG: DUF1801 domain-containing protein [Alphaproteobacteria bacterium]|nr:DUF1801 domain-containing protein [Alphaproteobacteria bacterium]